MNSLRKKITACTDIKKSLSCLVLWIYTWVVFILQAMDNDIEMTWLFAIFLGAFSALLSFFVLYILNKLPALRLSEPAPSKKTCILGWLCLFAITFAFYMLYFAALFPGGMTSDTINQFRQALTGEYSNWHPALHTFLYFTLPLMTGHGLGLIVFLQILYFCLAFAYLVYVLYRNGCPKLLLRVICAYVWINPFLACYLMYPWKDMAFMTFAMVLVGYYIQIILSKGKWLQQKKNIVLFSVVAVVCAYMRHNAILFVALLVIIVFFYSAKGKRVKAGIVLSLLACNLLVQGLYSCLDVEDPEKRTLETVGLPVTVWCNVMKENHDALPEETQEVMYTLATQEAYEVYYIAGSFNNIKWSGMIDTEKIDEMSYGEVLLYTWQCFRYAPKESFEAFAKLTSLVWGIDGDDAPRAVAISENEWGITTKALPWANALFTQINAFLTSGIGQFLFGSFGMMLCAMLAVGLALFSKGRAAIVHILPLFCYNFGTMLLLSGRDYRFFLLNIPLWIPTIFLMYRDETKLPFSKS